MSTTTTQQSMNPLSPKHQSYETSLESGRGKLLWFRLVAMLGVGVAVILLGVLTDSTMRYSLTLGTLMAIAVLGNSAITGTLGEINLGAGAYMALGAYTMAWGMNNDLGWLTSILLVLISSFILGALIAVPISRLKGLFTALATFALAYSIPDLAIALSFVTGGDAGTPVPALEIAGVRFDGSSTEMLIFVSVLFCVLGAISLLAFSGRVGHLLMMVGEAQPASRVFGIRILPVQIFVWGWATMLGAIAGAFYGMSVGYLNPTIFVFFLSIQIFVGSLIGGSRSVAGAWLGGLLVGALPHNIQSFAPAAFSGVIFGVILIVALLLGKGGLGGALDRLFVLVRGLVKKP